MTARTLALTLALAATTALATDAPHDASNAPPIECDSCHTLHIGGVGGALTTVAGNYNLCKSCHDSRGPTFTWTPDHQAVPGREGRSHRWDAPAVNAERGASTPTNNAIRKHLRGGLLQCSACHDAHNGAVLYGGLQRTSVAVGAAVARTAGSGSGTLVLNQPAATAAPRGYRIQVILSGATGVATFRLSTDGGTSWFGWAGTWLAGAPNGRATGANVTLNDGSNVTVTFSGSFQAGDQWDFYVSYPMLQVSNAQGQLCEDCHAPRAQSAAYVESGGDGVKVFSHPVGEALARAYDRPANALLDADGNLQAPGDGNKTNDLTLDTANMVRCTSCHAMHNTDSNSLTEDLR